MNMPTSLHAQRGVTLFVGMIMLILITLMVTTAFKLSNINVKSVGNMQERDATIASANVAIEQVLSSSFTDVPVAENVDVDINDDGSNDYAVTIAQPVCVRASIDTAGALSSITLGSGMSTSSSWNTIWDIQADVNDTKTGAKTTVNAGVRVLLTQAQKDAVCS